MSQLKENVSLQNVHSPALDILFCGTEKCEPLHFYGPNVRTYSLIVFVHKGKGVFRTKETMYSLAKGASFFIFPGEVAFYQADKDEPWEYYWIAFNNSFALQDAHQYLLKSSISAFCPVHICDNHEVFLNLFSSLLEFSNKKNDVSKIKVVSLFWDIVYNYGISKNSLKQSVEPTNDFLNHVSLAVEYIKQYYSQNLSVSIISEYLGISREHFHHLFKKQFNIAPSKFITEYRLQQATVLLATTNMKIFEISEKCGFMDYNYFTKVFKKHYNQSPRSYRVNGR